MCALLASDLSRMQLRVQTELLQSIASCLAERAEAAAHVSAAVTDAVQHWSNTANALWLRATDDVTARCSGMLQAVKGVTATYRMTNRCETIPVFNVLPFVLCNYSTK